MTSEGWRFGDLFGADRDEVNGATYLHQIYTRADPNIPAALKSLPRRNGMSNSI